METKVNYTMVGLFVIVLLAAIIFSILWLSAGMSVERRAEYMVYMRESISGLNIDSAVEFNGVTVGTVKNIDINAQNPQIVDVILDVKASTPITQGTTAILATRGVTGNTYISLIDKGTNTQPLVKQGKAKYPVIKTGPSLFTRLDTALVEITSAFKDLARSFNQLFDKENQRSIKSTLQHLEDVTNVLSNNGEKMTLIFQNTSKATQQLNTLLESSDTAVINLNSATSNLLDLSSELKQNPSILFRGKPQQQLGPGER